MPRVAMIVAVECGGEELVAFGVIHRYKQPACMGAALQLDAVSWRGAAKAHPFFFYIWGDIAWGAPCLAIVVAGEHP